jgi:hypothetical protein
MFPWLVQTNSPKMWNPKVHYLLHQRPTLIHVLSHMNLTHTFPPYFCKIHFSIIHPSTPKTSKSCISFRFPQRMRLSPPYVQHAQPISSYLVDHPNNIGLVQIMKLLIKSFPVTSVCQYIYSYRTSQQHE